MNSTYCSIRHAHGLGLCKKSVPTSFPRPRGWPEVDQERRADEKRFLADRHLHEEIDAKVVGIGKGFLKHPGPFLGDRSNDGIGLLNALVDREIDIRSTK